MRSHINTLKNYLNHNINPQVIALSETKLPLDVEDSRIVLNNYSIVRKDRSEFGGGVALYIHNSFKFEPLHTNTTTWTKERPFPEYIIGEVYNDKGVSVLVAVVYRPPHAPFNVGTSFINDLNDAIDNYNHIVIIGDFNADKRTNIADYEYIEGFATENSLYNVPYGPTFHYMDGDSELDICLVNELDEIVHYSKSDAPFVNGHDLILIKINVEQYRIEPVYIYTRDYNKLRKSEVLRTLQQIDWDDFLTDGNVNTALDKFYSCYFDIVDKIAPLRKVMVNNVKKGPWKTNEIKNIEYRMRCAFKQFLEIRTEQNYALFKQLQVLFHDQLNKSYQEYQKQRILNTPNHMLHRELQNLGLLSKKSTPKITHTPEELNIAFTEISTANNVRPLDEILEELRMTEQTETDLFYFQCIKVDELLKTLNSINSNATGVDNLSLKLLKLTIAPIAKFLCDLFNLSLNSKMFPHTWKKSIIVPLNKVSNPQSTSDYRPVSLQCCLAKIFEKLVYSQIETFVNRKNLRDPMQSAYRAHHSTQTVLLKLTSDIKKAMDNRELTLVLLLDYSKCFDKLSREQLVKLLYNMGFSFDFISWLISYLTERMQATKRENGTITEFLMTNMGLPQGSVLVTIFFPLYIMLIAMIILFCKRIEFSDDRQMYIHCKRHNLNQAISEINNDLAIIKSWSADKSMSLNITKTKAILIGNRRILNQIDYNELPQITDGTSIVKFEKSVENLGIIIDETLTFKERVLQICSRVHQKFYQLYNFRRITDRETRIKLVNSLIQPIIDYGLVVTMGISDELETKLQRLSNKCVRYIEGLPRDAHITQHRRGLHWLTIADRRRYFALCILYKAYTINLPTYIDELFVRDARSRPSRSATGSNHTFKIPEKINTDFYKNSFPVETSRLWNQLPVEIINSSSLEIFKRRVREYLFQIEPITLPLANL